jgi:hypothetical protein
MIPGERFSSLTKQLAKDFHLAGYSRNKEN